MALSRRMLYWLPIHRWYLCLLKLWLDRMWCNIDYFLEMLSCRVGVCNFQRCVAACSLDGLFCFLWAIWSVLNFEWRDTLSLSIVLLAYTSRPGSLSEGCLYPFPPGVKHNKPALGLLWSNSINTRWVSTVIGLDSLFQNILPLLAFNEQLWPWQINAAPKGAFWEVCVSYNNFILQCLPFSFSSRAYLIIAIPVNQSMRFDRPETAGTSDRCMRLLFSPCTANNVVIRLRI